MAKEYKDLVVGLDIGTAKVMVVVAEVIPGGKLKLAGSGPEKTGDCKASGDGKWLVFPNSLAQNAQGDTLDESTLTGDVEAACQARCANNPNCNVWAAENSTGRCVLFPDASDPIAGGYAHWTTGVRAALLNK